MGIEALSDKETKLDDGIDILSAKIELETLGNQLALEILSYTESSKTTIIISSLISLDADSTDKEVIGLEINRIKLELLGLCSLSDMAQLDDIDKIIDAITSFTVDTTPTSYSEIIALIDELLISIINNSNINTSTKNKFFQRLKGRCEENHQRIAERHIVADSDIIQIDSKSMPVNISYVVNPELDDLKSKKLRGLKKRLQLQSSLLFQYSAAENIEQIHGDEVVSDEEELYQQSRFYADNSAELIENMIPGDETQGYPLELIEILKANTQHISYRQVNMAKIQLIRIYREYVNMLISEDIINQRIINEQRNRQVTQLRIGIDSSAEVARDRRTNTRRLELFNMWHMGTVKANEINQTMPAENLVPISTELLAFSGGKKLLGLSLEGFLSRMDPETRRKFDAILKVKDLELDQSKDGIPYLIFSKLLVKLGIATPAEQVEEQIEISNKKEANTRFKTYTVKVRNSGSVAVDHKYRTLLISTAWKPKLSSVLKSLQHEAGHIIQQISRDQSILPGAKQLSGFGRSSILAEAGAIKSETLMTNLLGGEREINIYHVDILRGIIEGKDYWEIINIVLKTLCERNTRNVENKSNADLIKTAIKTVNRAYASLGAMGNGNIPEGRYPTDAGFLSYTYQGLPEFSSQPFYISGIPAHRTDLQEFMPQPIINGTRITEEVIALLIIESAYEALKEKGLLVIEN